MTKLDVAIIGGSLAGAACARELARLGIEAAAFERDRFPRAKVCGGFVSPGAVASLDRLGLLEEARLAGAVSVTSARVRLGRTVFDVPFERPGLGISRSALDEIVARGAPVFPGKAVREVKRTERGFVIAGQDFEAECRMVVDAAGKLSRFTRRTGEDEFGVQYTEDGGRGGVLDFWFMEGAYGGAVSVEGGKSNFCFLAAKRELPRYLDRPGCLVTGPIAYRRAAGEYLAIGDAAGMVDPFCGEGMRHALDSGMLAAKAIAEGIRSKLDYAAVRQNYERELRRRWALKRAMGAGLRRALKHPEWLAAGRWAASAILNRLWG